MLLKDLMEFRRNPELNVKQSVRSFIMQYAENPNAYLHTTNVMKVGIYPKVTDTQDSPLGIYAFRIIDILENIENMKDNDRLGGHIPYYGGENLFILESDIDANFVEDYTEEDLKNDIEKIKELYGITDEKIKNLKSAATTNPNFVNNPAGYLWGMTKAFAAGVTELDAYTATDIKKWASVLRKLGYKGFNDIGYGLIHGAESSQALFLTSGAYTVIDHMREKKRQKEIDTGDAKYKGRVPKNLVMKSIPNVFFYNNEPEDFANVRTWTVNNMSIDDFKKFKKFLPWNAKGVIEYLFISSSDAFSYQSSMKEFLSNSNNIPKNITVKNLVIGQREPCLMLRKMDPNFPVEYIIIQQYAEQYGLDKLLFADKIKLV